MGKVALPNCYRLVKNLSEERCKAILFPCMTILTIFQTGNIITV